MDHLEIHKVYDCSKNSSVYSIKSSIVITKMKGEKMDKDREIIEAKDREIRKLEMQLMELREAQRQSAATIAVDYNTGPLSSSKGIVKVFPKVGVLKVFLVILILLIITSSVIWLFVGSTSKQKSVNFVEQVQELSTLATAKAYMKAVIHEKDSKKFLNFNLPGTKREVLLVVPSTVIAGVDLKGITSDEMVVNEETKKIDITLPHAALIQDPSLQLDNIITIVDGGIFRGEVKWDEGMDLTAKAQEQIRQDAISSGLLVTAEENAEKSLTEFFKNIGYTVSVNFN